MPAVAHEQALDEEQPCADADDTPSDRSHGTSALVVEGSTIRTHVKRIPTKLDLRDRIQVVIFAYENGLIGVASAD